MDYREYAKSYLRYQEIENYNFPEGATKEEVISQLKQFSAEKKEIQDTCNGVIREYIEKYEKNPELLDEAAVKNLTGFRESLNFPELPYEIADMEIAYHILELEFLYYEKAQMHEEAVTVLDKLCYYESVFNSHMVHDGFYTYTDKVEDYLKYFDELSVQRKTELLDCYLYGALKEAPVSETVEAYKKRKAFLETAKQSLDEELIQNCEIVFYVNAAGVIAILKRQEDEEVKAGKRSAEDCTDLSRDKETLKELLDELKTKLDNGLVWDVLTASSHYLQLAYQIGEITVDEMLCQIKERAQITPEDDMYTQWGKLFLMNGLYLHYLYLYSPKSPEEVAKETEELVNTVMEKAQEMSAGATDFRISYYILMFMFSASFVTDYTVFKGAILDATVYANKALYVHTMMVKEISEILLRAILEHDVDYLDGVAGYDTAYIKEHPQKIMEIMGDCALLHDIGKYLCLDYTSNSYRRLTDGEFKVIKCHPENYETIYRGTTTLVGECVRDCALLHHRWYNGEGGYPNREHTKNRPFVGILSIADSIDAALDTIGRPYGEGKTLDDLIAEFEGMRDTRYSSRVTDILKRPEVKAEVEQALKEKQQDINYEVYQRVHG